jgi:hypothetical protein
MPGGKQIYNSHAVVYVVYVVYCRLCRKNKMNDNAPAPSLSGKEGYAYITYTSYPTHYMVPILSYLIYPSRVPRHPAVTAVGYPLALTGETLRRYAADAHGQTKPHRFSEMRTYTKACFADMRDMSTHHMHMYV